MFTLPGRNQRPLRHFALTTELVCCAACVGGCSSHHQPTESELVWQREVLESSEPVLVIFRMKGCDECRKMDAAIELLSKDFKVRDIDYITSPEIAERYRASAKPSILIFSEGKVVASFTGVTSEQKLRGELEAARRRSF